MEITEILSQFNNPINGFPIEAVDDAILRKEEIVPHLLNILKKTVENHQNIDPDQMDYMFALFVLSKFREKKAFPFIIII